MIIRTLRLQYIIDLYTMKYLYTRLFALSSLKQKKIEYLIDIIQLFNFFIINVGRTKSITLLYTLSIYNLLFEYLTESYHRLQSKLSSNPQVKELIDSIDCTEVKLDKYYNKVYTNIGSLYRIESILNLNLKLSSFNKDFCQLNFVEKDWATEFEL